MTHKILAFVLIAMAMGYCSAKNLGYSTYHAYSKDTPLTSCACSDGKNGIITRFNYNTISPFYPYVTAWSQSGWNSPNCADCIALKNTQTGKNIFVTAIDQCGEPPAGFNSHFDLSPEAFFELFGEPGVQAGHGTAEWSIVAGSNCRGNRNRLLEE